MLLTVVLSLKSPIVNCSYCLAIYAIYVAKTRLRVGATTIWQEIAFVHLTSNLIFITDLQLPLHTANLLILTNLYREILGRLWKL